MASGPQSTVKFAEHRSRRRRAGLLLPLVLVCALLAAACGSDSDSGDTADTGSSGHGDVDAADLDRDATLRWAGPIDVVTMDPHQVTAASANQFLYPVYDALTFLNVEGEPEPMLATSWESTEEPASTTFHLQEGLTFDSGTPFDATAVKANIERAMNADVSLVAADLEGVTGVEVVDDLAVKVSSDAPLPELPLILADRPGMMIDPAAFDSPDLAAEGAGIGPFDLSGHTPGSKVEFVRSEDYWDPEAQNVAGITMLVIRDDAARINAVISGEADLLEITGDQYDQARGAGLNIVDGPVLQTERIGFNTAKSEFDKPEVRQALSWAIDREGIVSTLMAERCEVRNQFAPDGHIMHSESVPEDLYQYDPDEAKDLLASVGLEDGFSFEALVSNATAYLQEAQVLQQNFEAIGVDMKLTPIDGADIINAFYKDKQGDAIISGAIASGAPSTWAQIVYAKDGFRNPGGTNTPEIEELATSVRNIADPDELEQAWDDLGAEVADYAFDAQICGRTLADAAIPRVTGLEIYLASQRQLRGVGLKAE